MRERKAIPKSRLSPPARPAAQGAAAHYARAASIRGGPRPVRRLRPASPLRHARYDSALADRHRPARLSQLRRRDGGRHAVQSPSNAAVSPPNTMNTLRTGLGGRPGPHAAARRLRPARRRGLHAGPHGHAQWYCAAAAFDIRPLLPATRKRVPGRAGGGRPARSVLPQSTARSAAAALHVAAGAGDGLPFHSGRFLGLPLVRGPRQQSRRAGHQRHRRLRHLRGSAAVFRAARTDAAAAAAALVAADHSRLCLALLGRSPVNRGRRLRGHAGTDLRRLSRTSPGTRFSYPASSASWRPATASTPISARSPARAIASRARAWR